MHSSERSAVEYMESLKDKLALFMKVGHTNEGFSREEIEEQNKEAVRLMQGGASLSVAARMLGLNRNTLRSRFRRNPKLFELTKVNSNHKTND